MRVLSSSSRFVGLLVCATALSILTWLWTVPAVMSRSTFASLTVFLLGAAGVTLVTWRNAQATGSTAQLLHETDVADGPRTCVNHDDQMPRLTVCR
jgi:hypothetical protein